MKDYENQICSIIIKNQIYYILSFLYFSQNPNNSLTPDVLKWNVIIISAILYENEKLHFKFVLAKSVNVANIGTGGFSIIGLTEPNPIYTIGNAVDVSN